METDGEKIEALLKKGYDLVDIELVTEHFAKLAESVALDEMLKDDFQLTYPLNEDLSIRVQSPKLKQNAQSKP